MKNLLLSLLAGLAVAVTAARAELYSYFALPTTADYLYLGPTGINNHGDVVGVAFELYGDGRPVAFHYASGATALIASPGPAHSTWGYGINSAGTIFGFCDRNGSVSHAMYATAGGPSVDMDSDFSRSSYGKAINDSNYVVGQLTGGQPFLGHTSGWIFPLGSTVGNSFVASGINNNLEVVGNGPWGGEVYNAWTGTITYLGFALGTFSNHAAAINNSGVVAGTVGTQGFLYSGGVVTYFGSNISGISGVNSNGDVVGRLTSGRGFVYIRSNGHFLDLNSVVSSSISSTWTLKEGSGINDNGVICGYAERPSVTSAEWSQWGSTVHQAFKITPFSIIYLPYPFASAASLSP